VLGADRIDASLIDATPAALNTRRTRAGAPVGPELVEKAQQSA